MSNVKGMVLELHQIGISVNQRNPKEVYRLFNLHIVEQRSRMKEETADLVYRLRNWRKQTWYTPGRVHHGR